MGFDDIDRQFRRSPPEPEPICDKCEGGGWECYGLGWGDPHFRVCTKCDNPEGLECP